MSNWWTRAYRNDALSEQGGVCAYCLTPLARTEATADHVRPKAYGGADKRDNIVACCRSCNELKAHISSNQFKKLTRGPEAPPTPYLMTWATYRINKRTKTACRRILKSVGVSV